MRSIKVIALALLFLGKLAAQTPDFDSLTVFLEKMALQPDGFPGFGVALVRDEKIVYARGFGYANLETKTPYASSTVQAIGSISKTTIGFSLMKCVEMGLFTLDTRIDDLLPFPVRNPRFPDKAITIRQLATHTSGILDTEKGYYRQAYVLLNDDTNMPRKKLKDFEEARENQNLDMPAFLKNYLSENGKWYSKSNFGKSAPGTEFNYSNVGATLAAYIVELKTGIPFEQFTDMFIFKPLKMASTDWAGKKTEAKNRARGYDNERRFYPAYRLVTYPDGFLHTSVDDLAKYLLEMTKAYKGRSGFMRQDLAAEMMKKQFSDEQAPANLSPREPNSGIFWSYSRHLDIGHSGSDPGVSTFMFFDPNTGKGRILFINADLDSEKAKADFKAIWERLNI